MRAIIPPSGTALLGLFLVACAAAGNPADLPCAGDSQCPQGQICVRGFCATATGTDGGPVFDGGPTLDGGTSDGGTSDGGAVDGGTLDGGTADGGPPLDGGGGAGFGEACQDNGDCQSGICVQLSAGGVCSKLCSQDCPADWGCRLVNLSPVCVPPELALCATCTEDADCGGTYRCSTWVGQRVCLRRCTSGADCAADEACTALSSDDGGVVGDGGVDGGAEGRCVPVTNAKHCGACGSVCAGGAGVQCCQGQCVDLLASEDLCGTSCATAHPCNGGENCCGGTCVDTAVSNTHCGACQGEGGITCTGTDQQCCGGACVSVRDNDQHCGGCAACTGASKCCGLECQDLSSDPNNCVSCGSKCGQGQGCCGVDACTTLSGNDQHCGACGNDCNTQFPGAGNCCGTTCHNKLTDKDACGDNCDVCTGTDPACCSGTCRDLSNDPQHCGRCSGTGAACSTGQSCCSGACKNLQTDAQNCGACGNPCGAGQTCCAGQCKNLTTDPQNCGACGTICGVTAGTSLPNVLTYGCSAQGCTIATCTTGNHNLDGVTSNGCECAQDANEPTPFDVNVKNSGRSLGTRTDCDFVDTISGNLVPGSDSEDFFHFTMESDILCNFDLRIALSVPSGANYDLYLYKWNGSSWAQLGSSTNAGEAAEEVTCGGCNVICGGCGCDGCSTDGEYGVRVVRVGSTPVCAPYSLTIEDN